MPGTPKDQVYKNGEKSKDGCEGVLQVFVNGEKMANWSRYIPQDGDRVRIVFGPEESEPSQAGRPHGHRPEGRAAGGQPWR